MVIPAMKQAGALHKHPHEQKAFDQGNEGIQPGNNLFLKIIEERNSCTGCRNKTTRYPVKKNHRRFPPDGNDEARLGSSAKIKMNLNHSITKDHLIRS